MKKAILFVVAFIVCAPVLLGLATDSFVYSLSAVIYGAAWYLFFTHTNSGRKLLRKGYRIACTIMQDI